MAEIVDRVELEDESGDTLEIYSDGRSLIRHGNGRVSTVEMPSETASAIGSAPRGKNKDAKARALEVENMLAELGLVTNSVINKTLGMLATDGKYYSLSCLKHLQDVAGAAGRDPYVVEELMPNLLLRVNGELYARWQPCQAQLQVILAKIGEAKSGAKVSRALDPSPETVSVE
jgi:hypothetical protein